MDIYSNNCMMKLTTRELRDRFTPHQIERMKQGEVVRKRIGKRIHGFWGNARERAMMRQVDRDSSKGWRTV